MTNSITTLFGATSTADEVIAGIDLTGNRAIVTGGASGLGEETARVLAKAGADVTIAARNLEAAEKAAATITASTSNANVHAALLDLADQSSVEAFVAAWTGPLDILVDNAGVMANPETRTAEGWELQFATNHLGHFALTVGLHDALTAAGHARVVVLSSVGHVNGPVRFEDLDFTNEPYDPWLAYAQSKTANILFAVEAGKRWAKDGIAVNALNPGRIADTNLGRHIQTPPASFDPKGSTGVSVKNTQQGAATSTLLAASPLVEGVTSTYFEDCQQAEPFVEGVRRGVKDYALDPENARKLWEVSVERTGVDA
ncbi:MULTISPECIES: SDR family NAD(P)-dependent oxidoreductase [unclassified Rathayibacter]|uniref:SDR family NAD(P)-dependent oxidoreductase n=1 Tax=unclassified Rathayibacter TaxID=2609250 RepID=UPI00188BF481|nr:MULTISPECIES: SDR family NAD(P)-dependent oxidoreductase [unclassified Rathayibacter]MBF4461283.1 SDR family NAD(P)-dependent oxidoreductase [Rathayibacter sp. VKM Ac-2879]MBF4502694.1 SDR family NAD(P)-dependent oxidoreductase [Rathayibacter sp. VKM Ac-2878]